MKDMAYMVLLVLLGRGKTISMVYRLYKIRKKYGDKIYIVTNFPCKIADYILPHKKDNIRRYQNRLSSAT